MSIHCCELMDIFLKDPKVPLEYYPMVREYGLHLKNTIAVQLIDYCPWCSHQLPESLRDQYFDILEKEFGVKPGLDKKNDPKIPQEFKNDEWWEKRGL
jgi:hypothetical protein